MDLKMKSFFKTIKHKLGVLLILLILVFSTSGCKTEETDFMQFNQSITNMEISERVTGKSIILNVAQTDYLWSKLKNIQFAQGDAYTEADNYLYDIEVYNASEYIGDLKIIDQGTIEYIGFYYKDTSSSIDIAYIEGLFESNITEVTDNPDTTDGDSQEDDIDPVNPEDDIDNEPDDNYKEQLDEMTALLVGLEQEILDLENVIEEQEIIINQLEDAPTTEYILSDNQLAIELDDNMDGVIDDLLAADLLPVYETGGFEDANEVFEGITDWYEAYKSSKEKILLACMTPYASGGEVVVNCLEFRSLPPNVEAEDIIGYSPVVQVQFRLVKSGNRYDINTYIDQF